MRRRPQWRLPRSV